MEKLASVVSPGVSSYVYQSWLADWKSVAPMTVFMSEKPAPSMGSNSARRTRS